jgi:hypothetical protein
MSIPKWTGILFIIVPIAFNVVFFLLQRAFEYPDILRKPTDYILIRFRQGGKQLIALWYAFTFTAILFGIAGVLAPHALAPGDAIFVPVATAVALVAALVQILGLIRWPFVVPHLARAYTEPTASQGAREAIAIVFQALHRYAGVAIGEHLGYLFTSLWTVLIASAMIRSSLFPSWLGWLGLVPAIGILAGVLEEAGFKPAGPVNALSYILWSVWVVATGVFMVVAG